jgi:hypothetical protein
MTVTSKDTVSPTLQAVTRLGFNLVIPPRSRDDMEIIPSPIDSFGCNAAIDLFLSRFMSFDVLDTISSENRSEIHGSVGQTNWEDIGGSSETKRIVQESIEWLLTSTKEAEEFGVNHVEIYFYTVHQTLEKL